MFRTKKDGISRGEAYDLAYQWKDYAAEAVTIDRLVRDRARGEGRELLDVACGTGKHIAELQRLGWRCSGTDLDPAMLAIARKSLPRVRFIKSDMRTMRIGRKFDVLTCLFSAIAYLRSARELRQALQRFAAHLKPGGIAIVEPWWTEQTWSGSTYLSLVEGGTMTVARGSVSRNRAHRSIFENHYLVADRARNAVFSFVEHLDLAMFPVATFRRAFEAVGFEHEFLSGAVLTPPPPGRGLHIGIRQ